MSAIITATGVYVAVCEVCVLLECLYIICAVHCLLERMGDWVGLHRV